MCLGMYLVCKTSYSSVPGINRDEYFDEQMKVSIFSASEKNWVLVRAEYFDK